MLHLARKGNLAGPGAQFYTAGCWCAGAGKSTFLDALAMRNTGTRAACSIVVDGVALHKDIYQGLMAYVPQVRGLCAVHACQDALAACEGLTRNSCMLTCRNHMTRTSAGWHAARPSKWSGCGGLHVEPGSMHVAANATGGRSNSLTHTAQEDIFIPTLSVEETLQTAVDLRFGRRLQGPRKKVLLQHWLEALGLQKVAGTRVRRSRPPSCPCTAPSSPCRPYKTA